MHTLIKYNSETECDIHVNFDSNEHPNISKHLKGRLKGAYMSVRKGSLRTVKKVRKHNKIIAKSNLSIMPLESIFIIIVL